MRRLRALLDGWYGFIGRRSVTVHRLALSASAMVFIIGAWVSLRQIDATALQFRVLPIVIAAVLGVPLMTVSNTVEYRLIARIAGHRVKAGTALRVAVLSTAANLLPLPGGMIVKTSAIRSLGSSLQGAASATAAAGVTWVGVAGVISGVWLLVFGSSAKLGVLLIAVGALGIAAAYWLTSVASDKNQTRRADAARLIGIEMFALGANAFRLAMVFLGLGYSPSIVQVLILSAVYVVAGAAGFFPGGLGIREALAAGVAPLVGMQAALGFIAVGVDRLLGMVVHGAMAGLLAARSGDARPRRVVDNGDRASRRARRIGIWHPGVSTNQGDRAIQQAVIDLLLSRYPDATVYQFHTDPIEGKLVYPDARIRFVSLGWAHLPGLVRALRDVDLLIWGGGSLVQQSSLFHLPAHLVPAFVTRAVGTPVVCFGSGVEPLSSRPLRWLARLAFNRVFAEAVVRGHRSAATLREIGVTRPVHVIADPAASLRAIEGKEAISACVRLAEVDPSEEVCISVSYKPTYLYSGVLPVRLARLVPSKADRPGKRRRVETAFVDLVARMVDELDVHVLLVPMFHDQGDLVACEALAARVNRKDRVHVLREIPSSRELKGMLGLMEAHVGIRLHSCVLATSEGVPTLNVHYMQKGIEYFELLGEPQHALALDDVTPQRLWHEFMAVWHDRPEMRRRLTDRNRSLVEEIVQSLELIDKALYGTVARWQRPPSAPRSFPG